MTMRRTLVAGVILAMVGMRISMSQARADEPGDKVPVKIGMTEVTVAGAPPALVGFAFSAMMKSFTGLNGRLDVGGTCLEVAKKLEDNQLHLAAFQGVEFAWAQAKHPKLKPLMVAVYHNPNNYAQLVCRKTDGIKSFADLRGKDVALPKKNKEHCRVFVERHCASCGECSPKAYFGAISNPLGVEAALDDLFQGKCHAVVADKIWIDFYQRLKPGAHAQFDIVKTSEPLPPGVVAYREGAVDVKLLDRFRKGLMNANKSEWGRESMEAFGISSFDPVPADFQRTLDETLRYYPMAMTTESGASLK